MNQTVYILLPVHNRVEVTRKFILSIKRQTYKDYHLLLIDDGSTDGTADVIKGEVDNITVLKGDGNLWWAGCLQRGVNWLKQNVTNLDSIVLFANDDVMFKEDFLQTAVNILNQNPHTLLLPNRLEIETSKIVETGVCADLKNLVFKIARTTERINCLPTRALFLRMSDIQLIGDFHPIVLPHYLSDYEYTIRAQKKGVKLKTSSEILIEDSAEHSGQHDFQGASFRQFINFYFSKKNPTNPLYYSSFILLTCPKGYKLINLIKVWKKTIKILYKANKKYKK